MHKYFLNLNLQFFAADGGAAGGSEGGDATGDGDKGGSSTETTETTETTEGTGETPAAVDTSWIDSLYSASEDAKDEEEGVTDETMIPKKRFDSINTKYKETAANAKTLAADYEALQIDHKEVTAAHKEAADRVKSLESVLTSMVDTHMESIDESYHDLIPTDKTVEEKLAWIVKAKEKGMFGGGSGSYEYEIGGMSNPAQSKGSGRSTNGMNPLQLMQMGYGSK